MQARGNATHIEAVMIYLARQKPSTLDLLAINSAAVAIDGMRHDKLAELRQEKQKIDWLFDRVENFNDFWSNLTYIGEHFNTEAIICLGQTILHIAMQFHHFGVIEKILDIMQCLQPEENRTDLLARLLNVKNHAGQNVYSFIDFTQLQEHEAYKDLYERMQQLRHLVVYTVHPLKQETLSCQFDFNPTTKEYISSLHQAAATQDLNAMIWYLQEGMDPNVSARKEKVFKPGILGNTPLHFWVLNAHAEINPAILSTLLQNGADINRKNHENRTALEAAIINDEFFSPTSLQLLLKHDAHVSSKYLPLLLQHVLAGKFSLNLKVAQIQFDTEDLLEVENKLVMGAYYAISQLSPEA